MLSSDARVYVAGHRGMVGSAVWRALEAQGFVNLIGWSSVEVDLTDRDAAMDAVTSAKPDVVVVAAAKVGGIMANSTYPVEFLADNSRIQTNLFEAAHAADVDRLLFLGSSCIYPKMAPQPIPESALLTGPLETTNIAYAIAKISGIIAVQSYRSEYGRRWISAMPTNLYGPGDNYDLETAHVLPALIRRFHEASVAGAPSVTLWGTGSPRREFLHVDDLAAACLRLLDVYDEADHVNVGVGDDVTIAELAALTADVVGYSGDLEWDTSKPDGTPRKLLDVTRMKSLGWEPAIGLRAGIESTYAGFAAD
jgi:GDP-L-fucose synthase